MVYNVSAYMDFHPGGEEELMKAAGIDGTDLFDQVNTNAKFTCSSTGFCVLCCDKMISICVAGISTVH